MSALIAITAVLILQAAAVLSHAWGQRDRSEQALIAVLVGMWLPCFALVWLGTFPAYCIIHPPAWVFVWIWLGEDHTHWAHRLWIKNLSTSNLFHLASALSNYPASIALLFYAGIWWPWWIVVALVCKVEWKLLKHVTGVAHWPLLETQVIRFLRERFAR